MLDLFAGSGSASRAAAVRGWQVLRIDNAEGTAADVRADLATWEPEGLFEGAWGFDLVWASPPCTQLSTASRHRDVDAGLVLVDAALRIIRTLRPRWWVLENVHGATRAIASRIGPPVACYGSFYLWGCFPPFEAKVERSKTKLSGRRRAERRAAIPWAISDGLVRACEALAAELPRTCPELPPSSLRAGVDLAPDGTHARPELAPLEPPPAPARAPAPVVFKPCVCGHGAVFHVQRGTVTGCTQCACAEFRGDERSLPFRIVDSLNPDNGHGAADGFPGSDYQ